MTTGVLERPTTDSTPAWSGRAAEVAAVAAVLAVAFFLRLHVLAHGAGLAASDGYDDGVYSAAADALVHGRLPYRDFLLLHPPGILLALAPFADLGGVVGDHLGVGVARLVFIGIGTAGVGMVMALARPFSRRAALTAGIVAAIWFPLVYSERSTLLEPLGGSLVLAATLVARRAGRRSSVAAGVLAGLAVTVKIWYLAPLVVLALFLPRRRLPFLTGGVGAAIAVCLPFFAAAPATMVREVLLDQLGRPRSAGTGLVRRLTTVLGDPLAPTRTPVQLHAAEVVAASTGVLLLVAAVVLWRMPRARVFAVQAAASFAVLVAGPSFFLHYAALAAPWIALCLGIGLSGLTRRIGGDLPRAVAALLLVALIGVNLPLDLRTWAHPQPVLPLRTFFMSEPGCVVSDDPGLLADTDVLSSDLSAGCPLWPDVTGMTYDVDRGVGRLSRSENLRWQRHLLAYLRSGDLVVLDRASTGLSARTRAVVDSWPVALRVDHVTVRRVPGSTGAAVRSR